MSARARSLASFGAALVGVPWLLRILSVTTIVIWGMFGGGDMPRFFFNLLFTPDLVFPIALTNSLGVTVVLVTWAVTASLFTLMARRLSPLWTMLSALAVVVVVTALIHLVIFPIAGVQLHWPRDPL